MTFQVSQSMNSMNKNKLFKNESLSLVTSQVTHVNKFNIIFELFLTFVLLYLKETMSGHTQELIERIQQRVRESNDILRETTSEIREITPENEETKSEKMDTDDSECDTNQDTQINVGSFKRTCLENYLEKKS